LIVDWQTDRETEGQTNIQTYRRIWDQKWQRAFYLYI